MEVMGASGPRRSVLELGVKFPPSGWALGAWDVDRLSKIEDYLVDNLCSVILSQVTARGQQESGAAADLVPNWESSAYAFRLACTRPCFPAAWADEASAAT